MQNLFWSINSIFRNNVQTSENGSQVWKSSVLSSVSHEFPHQTRSVIGGKASSIQYEVYFKNMPLYVPMMSNSVCIPRGSISFVLFCVVTAERMEKRQLGSVPS